MNNLYPQAENEQQEESNEVNNELDFLQQEVLSLKK